MGILNKLVSSPSPDTVVLDKFQEFHFGAAEEQGGREQQEDTITAGWFEQGEFSSLSSKALAHRLWTAHKCLNAVHITSLKAGSTASTTIYDGEDTLITTTIGDSVAFAVIYNQANHPVSIIRLNEVIHHPGEERARVVRAGGVIWYGRMLRSSHYLALSRALGDFEYRGWGICDDPHIDIHSLANLVLGNTASKIQIITTCDGFTEPARNQNKTGHEQFLRDALWSIPNLTELSESGLAQQLCNYALLHGSTDNVSVVVQTVRLNQPFLHGVYDGHGGSEVAVAAAENIIPLFLGQCMLNQEEYEQQPLSTHKNFINFHRDNPDKEFYEPLAEQEMAFRTRQLQQRNGVYEKIAKLRAERERLVGKVVEGDESKKELYINGLTTVERLLSFLDTLNQRYINLLLNKQEVLECMQIVFEAKTEEQHKVPDQYGFDISLHSNLADNVSYLKRFHELGKILDALRHEFNVTLNPGSPSISLSRAGVFGSRNQDTGVTSPRSPLSRKPGLGSISEDN